MIVEFVAEFTLDPAQSTGRFEKYTDGSFVMMATTVPFSPEPGDDGYTEGFEYTWVGTGHLSFPVGTVYQVTSTADSGEGSLREAIEQANSVTEGIDTITFAPGLKGDLPLSSQLTISDDLTICGPAHQLAVGGQQETRVFNVDPFGPGVFGAPGGERIAVEIHDLTIADGGHGNGGAVGVLGAGSGTLTDATILHNLARGGRGGRAATGGNGQGGGIYNDAAILSLTSSTTALNRAQGGSGQGRGNQGEGLGGGIFNSPGGTLEIDAESLDATFFNHASDHDFQNIFGDLTEIQALPVERKLTVAASEPNGIAQRSPGQARVRHHCRRRRWLRRSFACPAPNRQHHA